MIEIIRAEEQHVAAIGKLYVEFIEFHADIDPIWTPIDNPIPGMTENHLRRFMRSDDGLVLVAIDGKQVVGYSLSEIKRITPGAKRGKYGYVDTMAVTAGYRRAGIGEKMFAEIIKWFQSQGIDRVEVQTASQSLGANSFWQKQGFTIFQHNLYKNLKSTRKTGKS
jgi:ribosomal protein S18 acetylase RimI-like enzyme